MIFKIFSLIKFRILCYLKRIYISPFWHYIPSSILKNTGERTTFNRGPIICGNVKIGKFCSINGPNTSILSKTDYISIGSFCSIGQGCMILDFSHNISRITTSYINAKMQSRFLANPDIISSGPILIEEDVWIGTNVVIVGGVRIGRGSIISANAFVTKDIPRYSVVAGSPAIEIKKRFNNKAIAYLESTGWWNLNTLDDLKSFNKYLEDLNQKK